MRGTGGLVLVMQRRRPAGVPSGPLTTDLDQERVSFAETDGPGRMVDREAVAEAEDPGTRLRLGDVGRVTDGERTDSARAGVRSRGGGERRGTARALETTLYRGRGRLAMRISAGHAEGSTHWPLMPRLQAPGGQANAIERVGGLGDVGFSVG